jgi:hypothetical protein
MKEEKQCEFYLEYLIKDILYFINLELSIIPCYRFIKRQKLNKEKLLVETEICRLKSILIVEKAKRS